MVEFAIAASLLFTLLFAICEFSLLMKDYMVLTYAAREGARMAALGASTTAIQNKILSSATSLNTYNMVNPSSNLVMQCTDAMDTASYVTLTNTTISSTTYNAAPSGAHVRIQLTYPHTWVLGAWIASMLGTSSSSTINVGATMIENRE